MDKKIKTKAAKGAAAAAKTNEQSSAQRRTASHLGPAQLLKKRIQAKKSRRTSNSAADVGTVPPPAVVVDVVDDKHSAKTMAVTQDEVTSSRADTTKLSLMSQSLDVNALRALMQARDTTLKAEVNSLEKAHAPVRSLRYDRIRTPKQPNTKLTTASKVERAQLTTHHHDVIDAPKDRLLCDWLRLGQSMSCIENGNKYHMGMDHSTVAKRMASYKPVDIKDTIPLALSNNNKNRAAEKAKNVERSFSDRGVTQSSFEELLSTIPPVKRHHSNLSSKSVSSFRGARALEPLREEPSLSAKQKIQSYLNHRVVTSRAATKTAVVGVCDTVPFVYKQKSGGKTRTQVSGHRDQIQVMLGLKRTGSDNCPSSRICSEQSISGPVGDVDLTLTSGLMTQSQVWTSSKHCKC